MKSIIDELDILLKRVNESNDTQDDNDRVVKDIPVYDEMKTKEQGINKALEKLAKYFYKLGVNGGGGGPQQRNDDIDIPDDWIDPKLKGKISGKIQDKNFEKNKVIWDPEEETEKLKKEVEINMNGDSDDDFDDFDYRDNDFGDDDMDTSDLDTSEREDDGGNGSGDSSNQSEKEKLEDAINDAINRMKDDKNSGQQDDEKDGEQSGQQDGSQQNGSQSGSQDVGDLSGKKTGLSSKDKMLSDLQDAISSGDREAAQEAFDDVKNGNEEGGELAGERIDDVSKDVLGSEMSKAGVSQKDIDEMQKMKEKDETDSISDEELNDLKRKVADNLEDKCKKKGGSALAKTIVRNALKAKINNEEWKNMLKIFLKSKAIMTGDMNKVKNGIKYGHKNHLWRDAVLPTKTIGRGQIQNINCIVDFSGSVNQDLVYTFLGKVIDLCSELNYTNVVVYGLGDNKLTLGRTITEKMLKTQGKDVVLSQTWDFIDNQNPGSGGTNFGLAIDEILSIVKKERDSVFLVFGDAYWSPHETMPLHTELGEKITNNMCFLLYYKQDDVNSFSEYVAILKESVKIKHIITTQASTIIKDK